MTGFIRKISPDCWHLSNGKDTAKVELVDGVYQVKVPNTEGGKISLLSEDKFDSFDAAAVLLDQYTAAAAARKS
jgi:hypothetical protein